MGAKEENYRHLGETMIKKFRKRNIGAVYCATKEEAVKKILEMIPMEESVTWGGSVTLQETGVLDALKSGGYRLIDRNEAKTPEEKRQMYARQVLADWFLMSTNAFSADGELVNIDGNGNRVSLLIHGPSHVIVLAGMNKFAPTLEDAVRRARNVASPANCVRLGLKTPCAVTGICGDCSDPTICCQFVITRHSRHDGRMTVILVGEDLGY